MRFVCAAVWSCGWAVSFCRILGDYTPISLSVLPSIGIWVISSLEQHRQCLRSEAHTCPSLLGFIEERNGWVSVPCRYRYGGPRWSHCPQHLLYSDVISNLEHSCKDSQGAPVTPQIHWRHLLWGSPRLSPSLPPSHLSILTHIYSWVLFPNLLGVGWRHCPFIPSLLRTRIFSHHHSAFVTLKIVMLI